MKKYELPISKTVSFSFKDYYYESLLVESPNLIPDSYSYMDDYQYNKEHTLREIIPNFAYVGDYNIDSENSLRIFQHEDGNEIKLYFIRDIGEDSITVAIYEFVQHDGFIENKYIWNDRRRGIGLIWHLFHNYILPEYGCIVGDSDISPKAQTFWENVLNDYSNNDNYQFFVMNWRDKSKTNVDYFDEFPDGVYENRDLRLGIEKIK